MVTPLIIDIKIKAIDIAKYNNVFLSKTNLSLLEMLRIKKKKCLITFKLLKHKKKINILLTISITIYLNFIILFRILLQIFFYQKHQL